MLIFYHAPQSRSATTLWLLEELEVPYDVHLVDIRADGGAPESYREIQAHKKVPAIVHDGVAITERAAIAAYLADTYPKARLAPPVGDPRRGPYLSWLIYADAVMDPCFVAKSQGWRYPSIAVSFGLFDDMVQHVENALTDNDYATGDQFTAADVSLASAIHWGLNIASLLPDRPVFRTYLERVQARPGFQRFIAKS